MKTLQQSLVRALLAFLLAAAAVPALAAGVDLVGDDTDLFTTNPSIPAEVPNVLIVLDNTSNWSRQSQHWPANMDPACVSAGMTGTAQGDAEICAIFITIKNLTSSVNVGLMMFDDQNHGAYVRFPMNSMTPANITAFSTVLTGISTNSPGDKTSSNTAYENPMNDVFRYFNSLATFTQNAAPTPQANVGGYTDSTFNNFNFLSGQNGDTCGYDYIIFIGNGFPNAGSLTPDMANAAALLNDAGNIVLNTTPIQNTGSNADVWSRFLFQYGVKVGPGAYRHVTTYAVNVCNASCDPSQATLLQSMATVSQGKYFLATSLGAIESAFTTIFAEVQAVNSVFAATTLPVSINVRGTNLNQVYIGVFRPDPTASPRWFGNLKQYQLGLNASTNSLQLVDANGAQAVNLNTGFITNTATSFWTTTYNAQGTTPALGFWSFRGPSYATTDVGKDQDSPDGDLVEKGGGAEMIRKTYPNPDLTAAQTRNLYTCTGTCTGSGGSTATSVNTLSNYPFNTSNANITAALLGTFQSTSVTSLSASGTTATAVTSTAHGFSVGNVVTIAGAVPNLFNGNFSIVSVPNATSFTYTLSVAPDTTDAFATLPGYTLNPSTDGVIVTGATPIAYNTPILSGAKTLGSGVNLAAQISAVVGNANQFSYSLSSSPTQAASGYSVTGVRQVQASGGTNVRWSNGSTLNNVQVSLPGHGYSSGNTVAISGATDAAFNTTGSVIVVQNSNTFTYTTVLTPAGGTTTTGIVTLTGSLPSGWGNGTSVQISGVTNQTNYNVTTASGTPISQVSGNTFQYAASGVVTAAASGTMVANEVFVNDTSTWTVGAAAVTTATVNQGTTWNISGIAISGSNVVLSLSQAEFTSVSSAALRKLAVGDSITIGGTCTYYTGNGANTNHPCTGAYSVVSVSGDSSAVTGTPSTSFASLSGAVSVTITPSPGAANNRSPTVSSATMTFSGTGTSNTGLKFTLSRGQYSGQFLHPLAASDTISFANCTYSTLSGGVTTSNACSGPVSAVSGNSSLTTSAVAASTYGDISGTVTVTVVPSSISSVTGITVNTTAAGFTPAGNATTIAWTGNTVGANVSIASITPGPLSVTASGTIYASKSGDLTNKVTSITNQSVATGTITAGLASNPDPNEQANLINWVRGQDNKDDENINSVYTDVRTSVHGDVLHSRPAVVNYNRFGDNNDVYIFYGSNDGLLRAIKGGQATDGTAGQEQWAFIVPEFFGKLRRLRNQTPAISSNNPKDYFFDGPIGVYTLDANNDGKLNAADGDKVYLFLAMRRGGRMIYALDVTNPTSPKLLWKHGCTNPTGTGSTGGCDTGWDQLGQTWSQPQLGYLNAFPTTLALIFGAGYDSPAEDFQPCVVTAFSSTSVTGQTGVVFPIPMTTANCPPTGGTSTTNSRTMGRGVFIVNATTGAILWRAGPDAAAATAGMQVSGMNYAIPADLAILKNRTNTSARASTIGTESVTSGFLDRIYAPDTGGNVWRIDVSDANTANWVATQFASIAPTSGSSTTTGSPAAANMRKLEFQSDVVYSSDANGNFDAVLVGSGDREHPFDQVVANRFYMLKDRNVATITPAMVTPTPPAAIAESNLFDITNGCLQSASLCTGSQTQATAAASLLSASGWLMQLANTGEKTIAPATTANGTVIFNTNQPKQDTVTGTANNTTSGSSNACVSDLGTARQYGVSFLNGNPAYIYNQLPSQYVPTSGLGRYATFAGGGFLPQPVPAVVQIGGKYYQTIISGVTTTNPGGLSLQNRVRTYWYKKVD